MDETTRKVLLGRIETKLAPEDENGCRLWRGAVAPSGFATVFLKTRGYQVNRVLRPDIPTRRAYATCGDKSCGNPGHWAARPYKFLGREKENDREREHGLPIGSLPAFLSAGCHICCTEAKLVVDHDHVTGAVRGCLCQKHNHGLGLLGDSTQSLSRVLKYLERPGVVLTERMPLTVRWGAPGGTSESNQRKRVYANFTLRDALYKEQAGLCAICARSIPSRGAKSHLDHEDLPDGSKKIRGLLCHKCNLGLGKLGDNLAGVNLAISYLNGAVTPRKDYSHNGI